jgi:Ca2+-binding EF-hand superfamily protein
MLFRKVDSDTNGIINEAEFIRFISSLDIYGNNNFNENVKRILNFLDPNNHKVFTYSDCVSYFQKEKHEMVEDGKKVEMSVLDKITMD